VRLVDERIGWGCGSTEASGALFFRNVQAVSRLRGYCPLGDGPVHRAEGRGSGDSHLENQLVVAKQPLQGSQVEQKRRFDWIRSFVFC